MLGMGSQAPQPQPPVASTVVGQGAMPNGEPLAAHRHSFGPHQHQHHHMPMGQQPQHHQHTQQHSQSGQPGQHPHKRKGKKWSDLIAEQNVPEQDHDLWYFMKLIRLHKYTPKFYGKTL